MDRIAIGSTKAETTRLGFGSSSVMGILNRKQSLALLECAFDAGIRHFDTAPMYGSGEAEGCLGEFRRGHPGLTTITTKFGIPPQAESGLLRMGKRLARPILQTLPGLKERLRGTQAHKHEESAPQAAIANPIFRAEEAQRTLDHSLAQLRTDHIDIWLLHEVKAIDLPASSANDSLLRFMEDAVLQGKVGTFGVGSDRAEVPKLLHSNPDYCRVTQYEWSILDPAVQDATAFRIHHRALSESFASLKTFLKENPASCRQWSEETGQGLGDSRTLARLMLKASYLLNPASILLFSSKNAGHIHDNVKTLSDASLDPAARQLFSIFQRENIRGRLLSV